MAPRGKQGERAEGDDSEFSITIEYDGFVTRFDLDEILGAIDRIVEIEILDYWDPEFRFLRRRYPYYWPYWEQTEPDFSYIGIKSVEASSITLGVFLGGVVVGYVAHRFKKGVDKSLFAEELERSGCLTGNVVGVLLQRINDWAERYVPKQRELGGRVTKITAAPKKARKGGEKNES